MSSDLLKSVMWEIAYAYWALALACFVLIFVTYLWKPVPYNIESWNALHPFEIRQEQKSCTSDTDCPRDYSCFQNECVSRLRKEDQCDPRFGRWEKVTYDNVTFLACKCVLPHLVNQKLYGSNCNVPVACGPHGTLDMVRQECVCNAGYRADGLECKKISPLEEFRLWPCENDELQNPNDTWIHQYGFHKEYIDVHRNEKCFRKPCTFDALSGRPLTKAKFDGEGCVCDPSLGQFGVVVNDDKYVNGKGYNACASIFKDRDRVVDVEAYEYFYLGDRKEPVSFLVFKLEDADRQGLNRVFANQISADGTLVVGQDFSHDFMQYFLVHGKYRVRTRHCFVEPLFKVTNCDDEMYTDNRLLSCDNIERAAQRATDRQYAYDLLYKAPACALTSAAHLEPFMDSSLVGRVVLNPHQLKYKDLPELFRSNGLVLSYDKETGEWTCDLASEPYKIQTYIDLVD